MTPRLDVTRSQILGHRRRVGASDQRLALQQVLDGTSMPYGQQALPDLDRPIVIDGDDPS